MQNTRLKQLISGTDTRYAVILHALRKNLQSEVKTNDGCIAFYNFKINTGQMLMKVFPFNEDVIKQYFPNDISTQVAVFERINADRPYEEMHHLMNFREKYKTTAHVSLSISATEILIHNQKYINNKLWNEYVADTSISNNTFDNLLFQSELHDFHIIPLPVLSSPCILLILPAGTYINNQENIAIKVRESVDFYLYNCLLHNINKDIKPGQIKTKKELIKRFIDEFSQVSLPIKYQYDNEEFKCFDWYGNWNIESCDIESCATFELTLADELIKIFMPTFFSHSKKMLHLLPDYSIKEQQVKETIQNIFDLLYQYWLSVNSQKLIIQEQVIPLVGDVRSKLANLECLGDEIKRTHVFINDLVNVLRELEPDKNIEYPYEFKSYHKIQNGKSVKYWKLRYNNKTLVSEGKEIGYNYLQYIMRESAGKSIQISVLRDQFRPNNHDDVINKSKELQSSSFLGPSFSKDDDNNFDRVKNDLSVYQKILHKDHDDSSTLSFFEFKQLLELHSNVIHYGQLYKKNVSDNRKEVIELLESISRLKEAGKFTVQEASDLKESSTKLSEKEGKTVRGDNFLKAAMNLRDKLLTKYPEIANHFGKSVLKIASPESYYRPEPSDKVEWYFDPGLSD